VKSRRALWRAGVAVVALAAVVLGVIAIAPTPAPDPASPPASQATEPTEPAETTGPTGAPGADGTGEYTVLLTSGADHAARATAVAAIGAAGGRVVRENTAIRALVVEAPATGFVQRVAASGAVFGVARARALGATSAARAAQAAAVPAPPRGASGTGAYQDAPGPTGLDPLDADRWGLAMIRAGAAREQQAGDPRVQVGILDTGIDASHPDLAANVDLALSRNFVTDIPTGATGVDLDGPCEFDGCVDPPGHDDSGHGTHVAGIVAAAANGMGLSGVAPGVTLVNIRAGQDAGLFFLQPVLDALTYGADIGLDVINMSFYVDPWLFNCLDNPADPPEARIEQRTIVEAVNRALEYAHGKGVTLIGSLGNEGEDLGRSRTDTVSPNFPPGASYPRPIDNATCFDLPVEGPHVIGVSAVGPSGTKAGYSNYGLEQISVAAPGGWDADGAGTPGHRPVDNLVLSAYPKHLLQGDGDVDAAGEVTRLGAANGVQKACGPAGCGYYAALQGTSMAAPYVAGVAALVVSEYGAPDPQHPGNLTMPPAEVERRLLETAVPHACPAPAGPDGGEGGPGPVAPCEGDESFNGYYGEGIVDALAAVSGPA
jgi:subtilisin family serine protease